MELLMIGYYAFYFGVISNMIEIKLMLKYYLQLFNL
jgi:hypothetical protein